MWLWFGVVEKEEVLDVTRNPNNLILRRLLRQPNTLQHIRDIIDSPLLHIHNLGRLMNVHMPPRRGRNHLHELESELAKGVFIPLLLFLTIEVAFGSLLSLVLALHLLSPPFHKRFRE